jgi:Domain of unknown function (DUF1707)/Cell wall-active antibiotics response 4TMS YvqF
MAVLEPEQGGLSRQVGGEQGTGGATAGNSPVPRGLRASDAERHRVAEVLRVAAGEGRLSLEELEERLEAAYAAKTHAELGALIADLPGAQAVVSEPDPGPAEMVLRTSLGELKQRGHWVVPRQITANTALGNIKIDFTKATCPHREVVVEATTGAGSIVMIVPRGWSVRTDEVTSSLGSVVNKAIDPPHRDAPSLRVIGSTGIGTIKVRYPYRRWFRRWFRRGRSSPR